MLAGDTSTDAGLAAVMNRWNDEVRSTVPAERLLVWDPAEGWEPLCGFLEVDVPAEPLPRLNDTMSFREGIIGGALGVVNEWWDERERPDRGPARRGAQLTALRRPHPAPQERDERQVADLGHQRLRALRCARYRRSRAESARCPR